MAKNVDTSRLFKRAEEAVEKGTHDYAIDLFLQILELDPDDIKVRMALRQVEKSKFDKRDVSASTPYVAALAGLPNLLAGLLATLFRKHASAIMSYEKYLTRYPFSPTVLGMLASALEHSGREESAIIMLEYLRQNHPNHIRTLRRLARTYVARGDIPRAMQRYDMILKTRPRDLEASKQVHDLAAKESIQVGWDDKGESFHEKIRDKGLAERLESASHVVRTADQATDAVERVKQELKEQGDNHVFWAELGDLQRRRGQFEEAIEAYEKALALDPKNQLYLQKMMDAKLGGFDARIEKAQNALGATVDDESLNEAVEALEKEKQDFWLAELKRRTEERPTDTELRYELGMLYFKMGKPNEATAEFQRVVRDPKYRVNATAMLGKCFALKDLDELAIDQFEKALAESSLLEESGKDIAYNLGVLYEKVGNYASAEDSYKKIFEIDIGYRDIAEKMEAVYKMRRAKESPSSSGES